MFHDRISKYEIHKLRPPLKDEMLEDLEWICQSLGFLSERDKDKTIVKIFEAILEGSKNSNKISSDEIASIAGVTRGAVVHHLNKMIQCGLVFRNEKLYELRMRSLQMTIDEIEEDINRTLENIRKIAKGIDEKLGLPHREF